MQRKYGNVNGRQKQWCTEGGYGSWVRTPIGYIFFVLPELPQLQKPLSAAFAPDLITRHRDRLQCSPCPLTDVYKSASGFVPLGNAEPHYTGYTHGNLYYSCPLPLHVPLAPTVKSLATGLQSSHETRH